jgi:hypothetical protein
MVYRFRDYSLRNLKEVTLIYSEKETYTGITIGAATTVSTPVTTVTLEYPEEYCFTCSSAPDDAEMEDRLLSSP